jgi:hypothetical protein
MMSESAANFQFNCLIEILESYNSMKVLMSLTAEIGYI